MAPSAEAVSSEYLRVVCNDFRYNFQRIVHCLAQLQDEDLWWRPHESANSLQNIVLHLCGNIRQWIIAGLGGAADTRNRPQEFADRRSISKAELLALFTRTFEEADAVLAGLKPDCLLEPKRIQGFEMTVLGAIWDTVSHFLGHAHQVVYITRLRLGDRYQFFWVPTSPEQQSAGSS